MTGWSWPSLAPDPSVMEGKAMISRAEATERVLAAKKRSS
jgi:hypothetical protein